MNKKWVHIISRSADGLKLKCIGTFVLDGSKVRAEGERVEALEVLAVGVFSPSDGRPLTTDDGEDFLKAISFIVNSSSLFASGVEEGPEVRPFEPPGWRKLDEGERSDT